MSTTHVSDSSFDSDVLKASGPVLVDFWAEWCGPCKMIAPALEEISDELAGQVTIVKMDIMENPEVPSSTLRQMAAYAAALGAIYPGRRVEAALLYTQTPLLIALRAELLEAHKPGLMAGQESLGG